MFGLAILALLVLLFGGLSIWQWRERDREDPLTLWGLTYDGAETLVTELAASLALERQRRPGDLRWLGKVFLVPVWLFWGALRAQRPEQQLLRWRLVGTRAGRHVAVELDAEGATFAIACPASGFWVSPGAPLEQQEGLRVLHPVGSPRWRAATLLIEVAFGLGVEWMRIEEGALLARVPLDALAPAQRTKVLETLEAIVAALG